MPISTLDQVSALIVIDLQAGVASMPLAHPVQDVVARAAALADGFRRHALPVVMVTVDGFPPGRTEAVRSIPTAHGWTELLADLQVQPSDHRVTKRGPGAFTGTELEPLLRSLGATQVVLAGVATSAGVEMTARHAFELGFNVALAIDAMTDRDMEAHARTVARTFPRIGETATAADILDVLAARPA